MQVLLTVAVTVRRTACRESACEEDTLLPQMSNRGERIVYWIAYSQADCTRFLTRDEFASIVLTAFNDTKKVQSYVVQWVFCKEDHSTGGTHYRYVSKALTRTPMAECKKLFG